MTTSALLRPAPTTRVPALAALLVGALISACGSSGDSTPAAPEASPPASGTYAWVLRAEGAKYPPVVPDDDTSAAMQDMIAELTAAAGYQHYEVSAFAKSGWQARHNRNYWEFGDYLGIGAGAHSKLSFPHRVVRQARYKQPAAFTAFKPIMAWAMSAS
eukprot:gene3347-4762_t